MTKGTKKKITLSSVLNNQFFIPVLAITLLVIFDLITNIGFFKITVNTNSLGNPVLAGNIITVLSKGTELVFLAVGMTLVTAATGGQDISVGATLAISGSVIFRIILASAGGGNDVQFGTVLIAFLAAVLMAMIFGAFNGVLVAFFVPTALSQSHRCACRGAIRAPLGDTCKTPNRRCNRRILPAGHLFLPSVCLVGLCRGGIA